MVMYKVKASTYLRRSLSGSGGRRLSQLECMSSYPPLSSDIQTPMLCDGDQRGECTWSSDFKHLKELICTPLNSALLFAPLGLLATMHNWGDLWVFWFNFIALVPLAGLLGQATEELALHTGDLIGGLLNATFGNAVEMIITVQSLRAGLLSVVQGSLLGSILSNLLLVLGMSFFAGGLFHHVQTFNRQGAACSTSMLMLACLAFIVPTVVRDGAPERTADVLIVSRLTALLIGVTYFLYLFFQLHTHLSLFKESSGERKSVDGLESIEEEDGPAMSVSSCVLLLFATTLLISIQSECLVGSIEGVSMNSGIPKSFIGVVLLPIVGNAAEHATAVTVAIKDKPDLVMGVAVGSSTQIAMFMVPFAVITGWLMDIPMTLAFSNISVVVLAFAILITIGVVQDGESNWLEGVMLMAAYVIIAIVFWFDRG